MTAMTENNITVTDMETCDAHTKYPGQFMTNILRNSNVMGHQKNSKKSKNSRLFVHSQLPPSAR